MPLRYEMEIREAIKNGIPDLLGVHGIPTSNSEKLKPSPCVYVLYDGMKVDEHKNAEKSLLIRVSWSIALAVRNVSAITDGANSRISAQVLASELCQLLKGWRPSDSRATPFLMEESPPPFFDAGLIVMAFNFSHSYTI